MTLTLGVIAFILAVVGLSVVFWSIIDTRKRYYEDYIRRKSNGSD